MTRMQRNGTAGGGRWFTRLTGVMRKKERDVVNLLGLTFAVSPHVTHPSDKQSVHFQLAYVTSSPLRISLLRNSIVSH